jgi:8-oxo-dGTP pyrophosphatase MutT (NUDIX family)
MSEPVPARPAATVLLVRDGESGLEVFMVARHREIDFASGALVFPGGSLEPGDHAIAADGARCGLGGGLDERGRAIRVAAVRETFEECGVLLARPRGSKDWLPGARVAELGQRHRRRSFGEWLLAEDLVLALDALTPFAHWITPAVLPKRFDTHFFILASPQDQSARHDGSESVDSLWINPVRALADAEAGKYTIVLATRLNLQKLAQSPDVASALEAARARPIVTVAPVAVKTAAGYDIHIPAEAGYGGGTFNI